MPFTIINGQFAPKLGRPDGDSVRFVADDLRLWDKLDGRAVDISPANKSVQLRLEGIDAIEKKAILPLSSDAKDNLLKLISYDEIQNPQPKGYVMARMTDDKTRRPICFIFSGNSPEEDGKDIFLDNQRLKESVNYKQMKDGFVYPLYYNTLFASLRQEFNNGLADAKNNNLGYWPTDASETGVTVNSRADLATIKPIWPKIWRRMDEYLTDNDNLTGFMDWLENRNERVDILSIMEERGIQDIVEVENNNKVRLKEKPENLRVVGEAGLRPSR